MKNKGFVLLTTTNDEIVGVVEDAGVFMATWHFQVVRLLEVFTDGLCFSLVFEYLASDLSSVLRDAKRSLDESVAKAYMIMLLKGIDYCHKLDIMHRVR